MASAFSAYHGVANGSSTTAAAPSASPFTLTALGRWSILNKQLPPVEKIESLHVYDFDNTLFRTPLPNPSIWNGPSMGLLSNQDRVLSGGWWHDSRILACTGEGADKEERRAWEGWWNEKIVKLVKLSMEDPSALTVLLTGRGEQNFSDVIKRMVSSKGLDFDMAGLKPRVSPENQKFDSTMHFKQLFLNCLMETYSGAREIRIYEDRPKHTQGFRAFLEEYNRRRTSEHGRTALAAEVVQVAETCKYLDPVTEVAEVQQMLNQHNDLVGAQGMNPHAERLQINKSVFFTSYMIGQNDVAKLKKLPGLPTHNKSSDLKFLGSNIMISPRPCPPTILDKVGGMGSRMMWEVAAVGHFEKSIWAVRVRPIQPGAVFHTESQVPLVVMAHKRGTRPADASKIDQWTPVSPAETFAFETVVGEKAVLKIETERSGDDDFGGTQAQQSSNNKTFKRKTLHGQQEWQSRNGDHHGGSRGFHSNGAARGGGGPPRGRGGANAAGRGNRNFSRGGHRGGGGRGRGGYRSLDDVATGNHAGGGGHAYPGQVNYDEAYPALGAPQGHGRGGGQQQFFPPADLQNYY